MSEVTEEAMSGVVEEDGLVELPGMEQCTPKGRERTMYSKVHNYMQVSCYYREA